MHREAARGATLVGDDRRRQREVRIPPPCRRVPCCHSTACSGSRRSIREPRPGGFRDTPQGRDRAGSRTETSTSTPERTCLTSIVLRRTILARSSRCRHRRGTIHCPARPRRATATCAPLRRPSGVRCHRRRCHPAASARSTRSQAHGRAPRTNHRPPGRGPKRQPTTRCSTVAPFPAAIQGLVPTRATPRRPHHRPNLGCPSARCATRNA